MDGNGALYTLHNMQWSFVNVILLLVFGLISGIVGGMGMGGGTLLIPLLSFLHIEQRLMQAVNLIAFIPMASIALTVHAKQGLLRAKSTGLLILPAVISCICGAYLATLLSSVVLRKCFAVLLIALGGWQIVLALKASAVK